MVSNLVSILQSCGSELPIRAPPRPAALRSAASTSAPLRRGSRKFLQKRTSGPWSAGPPRRRPSGPREATAGPEAEASGPLAGKMAAAGGGSASDLRRRDLLRLVSSCVLLAGEASPARGLHSAGRTLRVGPAAGAAVSFLLSPTLLIFLLFRPHDGSSPFTWTSGSLLPRGTSGRPISSSGTPARLSHFARVPPFPQGPSHPTHSQKGQVPELSCLPQRV